MWLRVPVPRTYNTLIQRTHNTLIQLTYNTHIQRAYNTLVGRCAGVSHGRTPPAAAGGAGMRGKRACAADVPPAVHAVSVWCETDIFEAVGLHYVPPHMRHFYGVSS